MSTGFDSGGVSVAPIPSPSPTLGGISSTDMEALRRIMSQMDASTGSSTAFAHAGNATNSFTALYVDSQQLWIIDSGAFDHMTGLSTIFSSYTPCSGRDKVRTADGTFSSISGKGLVHASPSFTIIVCSSCS